MATPKVPGFQITKVDEELAKYVRKIEIDYVQDGPNMFAITFLNQSAEHQLKPLFTHEAGKWVHVFKEGDELDIQFGYDAKMKKMLNGEITGTEAGFREHDPALFTIRGFDKLHRFTRGREQRTFENVKDSDMAAVIAGELGLGCDADDTGKIYEHVFQNNLSNIDFLYARARMINYHLNVTDNTLMFKKPQIGGGGGPEFTWQKNLKRVSFHLSTAGQVNEVHVRGWSVKDKKEIIGKASNGMEDSIMSGDKYGGQVAGGKFGKGNILTMTSNQPLQTQEEADAFAQARLNDMAMNFLTGTATVEGNMDVKTGTVITLKECGKKYDGAYFVTRATHVLKPGTGPGTGYTTRLQIKRTGVKQV